MSLAGFAIKKPITIVMVTCGIVLLGVISWNRLPQELFPPITYPQVTIATSYENAAPEEIEALITKPIEETVGSATNIRRINSTSREGMSLVMCEFNWGTDMNFAALNVREKIDLIKDRLPRDAKEPIVMKYNPFELPIMVLSVTAKDIAPYDLKEICRRQIKDTLEKIEGVAQVSMTGGREREILVELNQSRLRAFGVSILSIIDLLKATNLNYPAGTIETSFYEYLVRTIGEFNAVLEMKDVPMMLEEEKDEEARQQVPAEERKKEKQRRLIYLRDIATIKDTLKDQTSISRYNGLENISLSIQKQAGANTLNTAKAIYDTIEKLKISLPKGMDIKVVSDQSVYIKNSILELRDNAVQGGALAFIVIFLFLWDLKSSLFVTVFIPLSVLGTFIFMYFSGITLNMMSLGGLALGVGMLVDNNIVIIENIFRHRSMGKSIIDAARDGTDEVYGALLSSTLTTCAVFFPLVFVVGMAGQLFKELAITVTVSQIVSLFLAVMLMPIFMSRGKVKEKEVKEDDFTNLGKGSTGIKSAMNYLTVFAVIGIVIVIFLGSLKLFATLNQEFLPKLDQRQFILKVDMPSGVKLAVTDRVVRKIEDILLDTPEVKDVAINIGSDKEAIMTGAIELMESNQARLFINLQPAPVTTLFNRFKKRTFRITNEVVQELRKKLSEENLEGAEIEYILQESVFKSSFAGSAPVVIEVKGFESHILKQIVAEAEKRLKSIPGVYGVRDTIIPPSPETKININKDRAALYQLSVNQIANVAQAAIKGLVATKFKEQGREIDIRIRLRDEDRKDFTSVGRLLLITPLGINIFLDQVASLKHDLGPSEIKRLDKQRVVLITANLFKKGLNEIMPQLSQSLKQIRAQVPANYTIDLAGENKEITDSFNSMRFALIMALVLVYMIMASQFESLLHPFIIMFTVPLSMIGVSVALFLTKTPISVVALMGLILLGGIVVNNGILLVDFINSARAHGVGLFEAAFGASKVRCRPVLMTALSSVAGLIPLALGLGEGAELRAPMAITVIGGLLSATFLTLVVLPSLYILFEKTKDIIISPFIKKQPVSQEITLPKESASLEQAQIQPMQEKTTALELNERQRQAVEYIQSVKKITRVEYIIHFKVNLPVADEDLRILTELKFIRPVGDGVQKYYEAI